MEFILNKWWNDGRVMEHDKGYGPKIIRMLFQFLFTDESINSKCAKEKIAWDTMLENTRAQYVYENKVGARRIGIRKDCWKDQTGKLRTAVDYELSKEEFFKAKQ